MIEASLTVTNSTFSGNSAADGGGAILSQSPAPAKITNSTFSGNESAQGGGIIGGSGGVTIKNSILANNLGGNCLALHHASGGYNISDDRTCGFGSGIGANGQPIGDSVNPLLDPTGLQNNGGPTQTIALQSSSPAIDAISFASCTDANSNLLTTDQRGFGRPDPEDGSIGPCDIGAYEFGAAAPIACTVTYSGTFNGNLNISSGLICIINGTVTGNLTENGGGLFTSNATIGGNLQITGGGTFSMASTAVNGDVQIQNIPAGSAQNQICGTHVKGNLTFHNNGTAIAIGTASASCPGNTIGNDLQVNNNLAPVQVFDNTVGGNLQCQGNSSITGGGDTAKSLQGQCASF